MSPRSYEESEDVELDLSPGTLEKTNDPVRMYLREMGTVPLLTREEEVEIAKRIERGQLRVAKAISRSPIDHPARSSSRRRPAPRCPQHQREVVTFDEEELTEEILQARVRSTVGRIDVILKHTAVVRFGGSTRNSPRRTARTPKASEGRAQDALALVGRENVYINRIVRELKYTNGEKKRLLDKVNKTVDAMRTLERQIKTLETKFEASQVRRAAQRVQNASRRTAVSTPERVEADAGISIADLKRTQRDDSRRRRTPSAPNVNFIEANLRPARLHREEVHQPRTPIPRPDSGGQHRPDESRGQVRVPSRLQILDLRYVVDPSGDYPRYRRPGTTTIRIPVHMIETINKLIRTSRQLVQELGREASSEEIARRMDIPVAKVRKVLKIAQEPISLETPIGEEEDSHLGDFIEDRMAVSPSDAVISVNLKEYTSQVLRTLTPREERVIKMRFGLEDGSEHTLEEVGQSFQVTRERIRQIPWPRHSASSVTQAAAAAS